MAAAAEAGDMEPITPPGAEEEEEAWAWAGETATAVAAVGVGVGGEGSWPFPFPFPLPLPPTPLDVEFSFSGAAPSVVLVVIPVPEAAGAVEEGGCGSGGSPGAGAGAAAGELRAVVDTCGRSGLLVAGVGLVRGLVVRGGARVEDGPGRTMSGELGAGREEVGWRGKKTYWATVSWRVQLLRW
jgi:hypothetical protein